MGYLWLAIALVSLGSGAFACSTPEECTSLCYGEMNKAGCMSQMAEISKHLESGDITTYCSAMKGFYACTDGAFSKCDKSVNKSAITGGVDSSYKQICAGSPLDMCRMKLAPCSAMVMDLATKKGKEMCIGMKSYVDCVKEQKKTCDASITLEQLVGPMQSSFDFQCNPGGSGFCPGIADCMGPMMSPSGSDQSAAPGAGGNAPPQSVDIVNQCSKLGEMLTCLNTQLSTCSIKSPRSYSFKDVAGIYTSGCKTLADNKEVVTCSQFEKCMETLTFPTTPSELAKLTSDPQIWCSMMKSVMSCASYSPECKSDRAVFVSGLGDVNKVCPQAQVLVTVTVEPNSGNHIRPAMVTALLSLVTLFLCLL